jgi:vacuolar-type H+-ATPase subunit I/STV1
MAEPADISAWIILFMGVYSLAASIGEWRAPGYWASMLAGFEREPALRFLTGFFVLCLGAAIYLVNPWRPDDWLSVVVTVLGGVMALEGAVILAMGDRFLGFARWLIGRARRAWAAVSALLGIALIAVAMIRL